MNPKDIKIGMKFITCRSSSQNYQTDSIPWSCIGECEQDTCKIIHTITELKLDVDRVIVTPEVAYNGKSLKIAWIKPLEASKPISYNRLSFLNR